MFLLVIAEVFPPLCSKKISINCSKRYLKPPPGHQCQIWEGFLRQAAQADSPLNIPGFLPEMKSDACPLPPRGSSFQTLQLLPIPDLCFLAHRIPSSGPFPLKTHSLLQKEAELKYLPSKMWSLQKDYSDIKSRPKAILI